MAPRSHSECIRQIRRSLEQGEYGRYDLVPELFPLPLLLSERPRQLRRLLAQRLGVPLEKVRYKTFVSWLARYRAREVRGADGGRDADRGGSGTKGRGGGLEVVHPLRAQAQ